MLIYMSQILQRTMLTDVYACHLVDFLLGMASKSLSSGSSPKSGDEGVMGSNLGASLLPLCDKL